MTRWIQRDRDRLKDVAPGLLDKVLRILNAMDELGFPMFVVEGVRSTERQVALYAQGRTKPGGIVTRVDGITVVGTHQIQADGFGHAIDCAFVDDPGTKEDETYDLAMPWDLFGLMAEKLGLRWGGRFYKLADLGHIEITT